MCSEAFNSEIICCLEFILKYSSYLPLPKKGKIKPAQQSADDS